MKLMIWCYKGKIEIISSSQVIMNFVKNNYDEKNSTFYLNDALVFQCVKSISSREI